MCRGTAGAGAEGRAEGSHDEKDHALFYQPSDPSIDKKNLSVAV
jgi:hypothetical protein